jgi:hypothetical protein
MSANLIKPILAGVVTWVLAVPLVAALLFLPVMILAGPHSSVLPSAIQPAILVLGYLAVVAVPSWVAVRVFRRMKARAARHQSVSDDT